MIIQLKLTRILLFNNIPHRIHNKPRFHRNKSSNPIVYFITTNCWLLQFPTESWPAQWHPSQAMSLIRWTWLQREKFPTFWLLQKYVFKMEKHQLIKLRMLRYFHVQIQAILIYKVTQWINIYWYLIINISIQWLRLMLSRLLPCVKWVNCQRRCSV